MTQTTNRFFDEIGRLMNDAAGAAQGVKREVDAVVRNQAERLLRDLDVQARGVRRGQDTARLAREENEVEGPIAASKLGGSTANPPLLPGEVRKSFILSFPDFGAKARQLRGPRTPGGLLRSTQ